MRVSGMFGMNTWIFQQIRNYFSSEARAAPSLTRAALERNNNNDPAIEGFANGLSNPSLLLPQAPAPANNYASAIAETSGLAEPRHGSSVINPSATFSCRRVPREKEADKESKPVDSSDLHLRLGREIGGGANGKVYQDAYSPDHVIKVAKVNHEFERRRLEQECYAFNAYYGDDSAVVTENQDGLFLHMKKVPGIEMMSLSNSVRQQSYDAFNHMIDSMHTCGIVHADLHDQNVLFDVATGNYNPVDIGFCSFKAEVKDANLALAELNQGNPTQIGFVPTDDTEILGKPLRVRMLWETKF